MKRSQINAAIARAIDNAKRYHVALPTWAEWTPDQFGENADGVRQQQLGWKVVDFGVDDFENCGLVILVLCAPLVDSDGEPLKQLKEIGERQYPITGFSRKFLFVQAGQTEPHHFHRQKKRKEVTVVAGAPVRFELAWSESDIQLSDRDVDVQVDGIWHRVAQNESLTIAPGETITLPGELSHVISVSAGGADSIMLETSTANNDRTDNIFPYMTPTSNPIVEDENPRYQLLDEYALL